MTNEKEENEAKLDSARSRRETLSILSAGVAASSATATLALAQQVSAAAPNATDTLSSTARGQRVSVLDFAADPSGRNDSSAAFRRALEQLSGGELYIPRGRYLVEQLGVLGAAGQKIVGESRWNTVLATEAGGAPLFHSEVAFRATSAFHLLSDFMIDLNGADAIALDLASINCTTVQRLHIKGGSELARRGIGIRFASPLDRGAYDNAVYDCSFEYLDRGIVWDSGANNNAVFNCRIINCNVGLHAAPGRPVDTPRVFAGRIEGCDYGLVEGADCGGYFSLRFENSRCADIRFTEQSRNAGIWGGYTATTRLAILDLEKAYNPSIDSSDLAYSQIEESPSRPKISTGLHVFGAPGKAPPVPPLTDFAASFANYVLLWKGASLEFSNAAGDGRILGMTVDRSDEISISGYDRKRQAYTTINIGAGPAVCPIQHGTTDLGSEARAYKAAHLTDGVFVGGQRVLGRRQPAIPDDHSGTATAAKVNQVLATLRRLGLIES